MQVFGLSGKKLAILYMLSKSKVSTPQLSFFTGLSDQLDQKHPLYILSNRINWSIFEEAFKIYYSEKMGKPSKPIRLMVSLLILKHLRNLSDENLVEQWSENVYFQYFSGEPQFRPGLPCVSTELVAFRQRIGEPGAELILKESIRINKPEEKDKEDGSPPLALSLDTTVQEKNITYPTDDKLYKKIIGRCWKIAKTEGIELRQSYIRTISKLSRQQRMKRTRSGARAARKADRKIKTIAGRLVRELGRKLPLDRLGVHLPQLKLFQRVLSQKRNDTDKIYSLHEPDVKCHSKGKEHKKYEFGSKASILVEQQTGIIVGAINFTQTLHDSKTVPEALEQYERINDRQASEVYVDRGYRGISQYKETRILVPRPQKNIDKIRRKGHSRRAAIEPVIGHLKSDYRMARNYLKGILGDMMNVILAAVAMNFKRAMNLWRTEAPGCWKLIHQLCLWLFYGNLLPEPMKMTF